MIPKNPLAKVGPRRNVMQIVPPRGSMRPAAVHEDEHELITQPLEAPTGPGGAAGFHNVAGSQIALPQVTNVYLGPFWGDRAFLEQFSKAIVENGYLDPLRELHYGTGSGTYVGAIDGPALEAGTTLKDSDAQGIVATLIDQGRLSVNDNSLAMLILPDGVTSEFDSGGSRSCQAFCGYHDAFEHRGIEVAYAVLPSSLCQGCGGLIDDFTAVYAHELAEAATDKVPGQGWVADDGQENGDLEAWILIGWGPPSDPKRFTVQGYYTNERGNTIGQWRDTPQSAMTAARSKLFASLPSQGAVLGHLPAVVIASACAHTSPLNLDHTLEELGIDGISFQACVRNAVEAKGCTIGLDDIPDAPDSTLNDVVAAIENAPRQA